LAPTALGSPPPPSALSPASSNATKEVAEAPAAAEAAKAAAEAKKAADAKAAGDAKNAADAKKAAADAKVAEEPKAATSAEKAAAAAVIGGAVQGAATRTNLSYKELRKLALEKGRSQRCPDSSDPIGLAGVPKGKVRRCANDAELIALIREADPTFALGPSDAAEVAAAAEVPRRVMVRVRPHG
jgi:hypothetical protein